MKHEDQKRIWNEEHKDPRVLLQMDKSEASSGVKKFYDWLSVENLSDDLRGVEMGCGKGRNSIWFSEQGVKMSAFDFSENAIKVAKMRASYGSGNVDFLVHDATIKWPFEGDTFDFGIDCFASTDIESFEGRSFARDEFARVIKKRGFLFVYSLSIDDEFHNKMIGENPAEEKNAFCHPSTGKFEKVFDEQEILEFYCSFELVEKRRIEKVAEFFGEKYNCKHFWLILRSV